LVSRLLLIVVCLFALSAPVFAQEDQALQTERGIVASNLFKTICFMMYMPAVQDQRLEFLNSKFAKFDEEGEKVFLAMTQVRDGDAWAGNYPKGNFVIVLDNESPSCYVLAQKSDAKTVHQHIKALGDEARENVKNINIVYHPETKTDVLNSSGFEIRGPGDTVLMVVVASTPLKPEENKPEAIITFKAAKIPQKPAP